MNLQHFLANCIVYTPACKTTLWRINRTASEYMVLLVLTSIRLLYGVSHVRRMEDHNDTHLQVVGEL